MNVNKKSPADRVQSDNIKHNHQDCNVYFLIHVQQTHGRWIQVNKFLLNVRANQTHIKHILVDELITW